MNESRRGATTAAAAKPAAPAPSKAKVAAPEPPTDKQRDLWQARDVAIVVIAVLALVGAAKFAADLLIPVVLGLLGSYALRPVVRWLETLKIPRALGAVIVLLALFGSIGAMAWWLADDVAAAVADLPTAARKLRSIVQGYNMDGPGTIAHVQEAATELGKTAAEVAGQPQPEGKPAPVTAVTPAPTLAARLAENTALVAGLVSQVSIAMLLAAFMLAAGDAFRRKLVRIVGHSLARRRITVEILDEMDLQVQRQLMILVACNLLIAGLAFAAFTVAGLHRAALWAVIVGVLHFIPYAGTVIATLLIAAVALVQTGSLASALGYAALTFGLALAIGFVLMSWWMGKAVRMNAVATFVTLLFFGWLWGAWGLILGGPLMAIVKVCADRIDHLKSLGELLGE